MVDLTPETLRLWLEWAGGKLLSLPAGRIKPRRPRVIWPDYAQNPYETLQFRPQEVLSIRAFTPTAEEITFMDRILVLPNLCSDFRFRRIIHARSLVYPFNGRHLYHWTHIAAMLHISSRTAKAWHQKGLVMICWSVPLDEVYKIGEFFDRGIDHTE